MAARRASLGLAISIALAATAAPAPAAPKVKGKASGKAAAKPVSVVDAGPAARYVPTTGCPVAPPGKYAAPVKVPKKERGKSPIEEAPLIATVKPDEICANRAKLTATPAGVGGQALGLSSQVLNTQAGRLDLVALPQVERTFQEVLLKFSAAWPYARPQTLPRILFRVTDGYDAFALPDNTIVMSLGIIEQAESDSEILFVLAHEYSHLLMGHHAAALSGNGTKDAIGALGAIYTAGTLVSQLRANGAGISVANQAKVETAAKRAAVVSEALRFAVDDIWAPSYSRDQEYQADALAMDLLVGSNQTIDSYTNVLGRLQKIFDRRAASRSAKEAKASALQKSLETTMKEAANPQFLASVGMGNTQGLKSLGGKMAINLGLAAIGGIMGKSGGDTHPPPEERRKALAAYFQAGYPTADPPIDAGVMVGLVKGMAEYKNALSLRDKYLKARDAYAAQDFTGAMTGLKALGAGSPATPTFINYTAGLVARDMADPATATAMFEAGRNGRGIPSAQLLESYAQLKITTRDLTGAQALIDDANRRFNDPDHFRSLEIARFVAAGDMASAKVDYDRCLTVTNRDYIPPRCKTAYPEAEAAAGTEKKKFKLPGLPNPF